MYFAPHRSKTSVKSRIQARTAGTGSTVADDNQSDEYDSIWSDSEEEEFHVNPSSDEDSDEELSMYMPHFYLLAF